MMTVDRGRQVTLPLLGLESSSSANCASSSTSASSSAWMIAVFRCPVLVTYQTLLVPPTQAAVSSSRPSVTLELTALTDAQQVHT